MIFSTAFKNFLIFNISYKTCLPARFNFFAQSKLKCTISKKNAKKVFPGLIPSHSKTVRHTLQAPSWGLSHRGPGAGQGGGWTWLQNTNSNIWGSGHCGTGGGGGVGQGGEGEGGGGEGRGGGGGRSLSCHIPRQAKAPGKSLPWGSGHRNKWVNRVTCLCEIKEPRNTFCSWGQILLLLHFPPHIPLFASKKLLLWWRRWLK